MTLPLRSTTPASETLREKVFRLIKDKSFAIGQFVLASGRTSNYYLDMKPTMFDPHGAAALSELILARLADRSVEYVGGLALGAVPLISATTMLSALKDKPIAGFFVRKDVKDHGTRKLVEGLAVNESLEGKNVAILEDVTTTGGSAMVAIEAAQKSGAKIVLVLSVVDREEGATEFFRQKGIPFEALFKASDFLKS
jgi:orotate phosphoribosyltransferase